MSQLHHSHAHHDDSTQPQDSHQTSKDYSRLTPATRCSAQKTPPTSQTKKPKNQSGDCSKDYYVPRNYEKPWMKNSVMKDQSKSVDKSNVIYSLKPPKMKATPRRHPRTPRLDASTEAEDAKLLLKQRDLLSKPPCAFTLQDSLMMSKYLVEPGNRRHRTSSYKQAQEKVDQLLRDCRQQKVRSSIRGLF